MQESVNAKFFGYFNFFTYHMLTRPNATHNLHNVNKPTKTNITINMRQPSLLLIHIPSCQTSMLCRYAKWNLWKPDSTHTSARRTTIINISRMTLHRSFDQGYHQSSSQYGKIQRQLILFERLFHSQFTDQLCYLVTWRKVSCSGTSTSQPRQTSAKCFVPWAQSGNDENNASIIKIDLHNNIYKQERKEWTIQNIIALISRKHLNALFGSWQDRATDFSVGNGRNVKSPKGQPSHITLYIELPSECGPSDR